MRITDAQSTENGFISAAVDGMQMIIPADPGNRHYVAILDQGVEIAPYAPEPTSLEDQRGRAELSRFEFASRAAVAGFVSFDEAAAWAAGNQIPSAVQGIIDTLPPEQRGLVVLDVLARPNIRRKGNLMPALAAAFQTDDAGLDALYGIGV